ncbi:hypothetical protein [Porcipelethomonas sp.]|uniref:hypothetical protein n=1 Tax=Porcipelethomonas sp. TaxID=2981675 RepID=UPI003EF95643
MEKVEKIIENQKKINSFMEKYEDYTRKLLGCSIDDITKYINAREELISKIDISNKEILSLCEENSFEYMAYKNLCGRGELPDTYTEIFDLRQNFNSILARVKSMEPEIIERITIEREKVLKKIKENNSGQNAKAAKFFNAGISSGQNMFFPENKKQI